METVETSLFFKDFLERQGGNKVARWKQGEKKDPACITKRVFVFCFGFLYLGVFFR